MQTAVLDQVPFWRRTPPALFPSILGMFGLVLAWRRAGDVLGLGQVMSDLLLGAVTMVFLFSGGAYLAKVLRRPGVVTDEIRILPGLSGVSALTLSGMLLAAGLVPFAPTLAGALLVAALLAQVCVALLAVRMLLAAPPEARQVAPNWHLTFVGFVLAPLAAVPLGWTTLAQVCFWAPMPVAVAIWTGSL